jgi:hypothetical protein
MNKVNLAEKFNLFSEHWSPRIVGELNGQHVKLAKFKEGSVTLNEGEFYIVPKGVEHKPVADEEAHVMLLEPKSTEQTGGVESGLLVDKQPWI